jgi:hypothetical protein
MTSPEDQQLYRQRMDEVRHGLRTMFTGIGLMIFLFFIMKSFGAAIGAIVFFAGLGKIAGATVFASPRMSLNFQWPSDAEAPRQPERLPTLVPPPALDGSPPSVTEHTTIRLHTPESGPPREKHPG